MENKHIHISKYFKYSILVPQAFLGSFQLNLLNENPSSRPITVPSSPPGMRILVMLLLDTLPMLGNVLLLCFFVFFIFGIVGMQLWAGMLRQRCFIDIPVNVTPQQ